MSDAPALVRSLLLPLSEARFVDAVDLITRRFASWEISDSDQSTFVQNLVRLWQGASRPPEQLRQLFGDALGAQDELPTGFTKKYFEAIRKLQSTNNLLSFEQSRGLLSNTLFIRNLLDREGMSAAQIALVLNASQNTAAYTWHHVQVIADALSLRPMLEMAAVSEVSDRDALNEPLNYADASPLESIQVLADKANELGYPGDMADQLGRFLGISGNFESAFAIILHVNALITQFFDHPLSQAAYEFVPRGSVISDAMKASHPSYQAAESPYLNNAKGTFAFDANWAWGRKESNRRQAHALVDLLDGLGEMAYQPRRELAAWVRQWLLRMERNRSESFVPVDGVSPEDARRVLERICLANTETQGVLEQRLLDLFVTSNYRPQDGWRLRGVGDAVNASNVSKKKLGDLEVENSRSQKVLAFEPHGGKLSKVYVDKHRNSLAQVIRLRSEDFASVAAPADWSMRVIFIAHDLSALSNFNEEIMDFDVHYEFFTFEDFFSQHEWSEEEINLFTRLVAEPIDKPWVPDSIKLAFNQASGSSTQ